MTLAEIIKSDANALKLFSPQQINTLEASLITDEKNEKFYLNCLRRNKKIQVYSSNKTNPEEIIRQLYILKLNQDYGYPIDHMELEVSVQMGSSASKSADLVIYDNATKKDKENIVLIIEVKKPAESLTQGINQLESYIAALPARLGVWVDGNEENVRYRKHQDNDPAKKYSFERFKRVPHFNETIESVLQKRLKKSDLVDILDLRSTVYLLEQRIVAMGGVESSFDEIFKLIFAKLYDEQSKKINDDLAFQKINGVNIKQSVEALFTNAKNKWRDVFKPTDNIDLTEETLTVLVTELQEYKLFETDFEILDAAFEHMISSNSKGDMGQYFTPRPVIDVVVQMLNPHDDERVLDPSAGSAGFLLHTFQHVLKHEKINDNQRYRYATNNLFALDYDPKTVKIAKALMVIAGDGSSNSQMANTLDLRLWDSTSNYFDKAVNDKFGEASFDIVMTNPPFAGDVPISSNYLGYYSVARDKKQKTKTSEKRDVLFLERNLRFLKPGGRMAIVLPQGRFNNSSDKDLREYIAAECRILGVLGLHGNSFKPYTGTKTSVLLVQKWDAKKCPKPASGDYPIFFATNTKSVKDNSGNYIGKNTQDTLAKSDLPQIAEAFAEFAKKENLSFYHSSFFQ